ncbi:MAG: alpha/beta fold hydrolase [Desulfovibrio sp.]|jgi:3-oxoadipate enol-lactonase/4-carboxymuconolactone decarboxylase|nr:alpha/beta fold hydrolase [Desulfovibrio sp.]
MHDAPRLNTVKLTPLLRNPAAKPLLVVGPSLGTSAAALWADVAERLADTFSIIGFDLPGHGVSKGIAPLADIPDLAKAVLASADAELKAADRDGEMFLYAGVSVSGCIGLQLLLDASQRVAAAAIINSAAKIGEKTSWRERRDFVLANGTNALREASAQRWFAPGFITANSASAERLLDSLSATEAEGYAGICEALSSFDVRGALRFISRPVLAVGGEDDIVTPPDLQKVLARDISGAHIGILPNVGHLAPAEKPETITILLRDFFTTLS